MPAESARRNRWRRLRLPIGWHSNLYGFNISNGLTYLALSEFSVKFQPASFNYPTVINNSLQFFLIPLLFVVLPNLNLA